MHPPFTPPSTAGYKLYNLAECMLEILATCEMGALSNLSQADSAGRDRARLVVRDRLLRVLRVFFADWQMKAVFTQMQSSGAMIAGAVPWVIMAVNLHLKIEDLPTELKIYTPMATVHAWVDVLRFIGYCVLDVDNPMPYEYTVNNSRRFLNPSFSRSILLIETRADSIIPAVLSSLLTSEMCLLSPTRLIDFYPELTVKNITVSGFRKPTTSMSEWWSKCQVEVVDHTDDWTIPCGSACSGIWRRTEDMIGIVEFAWGGLKNDKDLDGQIEYSSVVSNANLKWRIGSQCSNLACPHSGFFYWI